MNFQFSITAIPNGIMSTGVVSPTLNGFPVGTQNATSADLMCNTLAYTMAEPQLQSTITMAPYGGLGKQ